jgi:hypothetical protein
LTYACEVAPFFFGGLQVQGECHGGLRLLAPAPMVEGGHFASFALRIADPTFSGAPMIRAYASQECEKPRLEPQDSCGRNVSIGRLEQASTHTRGYAIRPP